MRIGLHTVFAIGYLVLVLAVPVPAEEFEGIVVQLNPLQVRSLEGRVRRFHPPEKTAIGVNPKEGDLVLLEYDAGSSEVSTYSDIRVVGATLVGTVVEISADKSWLVVSAQPHNPEHKVNASLQVSKEFQPLVAAMQPRDGIIAIYALVDKAVKSVRSLEWQYRSLERKACWLSLISAALALFLVALLFTKGHPTRLYLGADNRYSNSKFQTVLWFWVVISAYCAIVFHRIMASRWCYIGGVDIPQNLLILSGISVLTFAAAKAITAGKVEQASARGEDAKPSATAPKSSDLVSDDLNRTDLGDFQMVVITILAVIIYAVATVEFMQCIAFRSVITMPDVDATLLAIFGLSQAAYLGKKAAGEAGAGITSDHAVKASADAASAAKGAVAKAMTARQTAQTKEVEAKSAAKAVNAAATKAAAQPDLVRAQSAAKAAREAANDAAAAAKAAEDRAGYAMKLAEDWSKQPASAALTKSSSESAQADAAQARTAATDADTAAKSAEEQARNAAS